MNDIHHYETIEVRDKGRLILPAGQIVNQDFKISPPYDASTQANSYTVSENLQILSTKLSLEIKSVIGSNYEYEAIQNERKEN